MFSAGVCPRLRCAIALAGEADWLGEGLIDPSSISLRDFEQEMEAPIEPRWQSFRARGRSDLRDPASEIGWWASHPEEPSPSPPSVTAAAGMRVREAPKVGRNDPCPGGSGRKYKKCHGAA